MWQPRCRWHPSRQSFPIWPTALADAKEIIQHCQGYQLFLKQHHLSAQVLRTIPPSWPFTIWSLNVIGLFPTAPGGFKYIRLVSIDKFTKWIEYKTCVDTSLKVATQFLEQIIYRFGVPNRIITDLGSQFTTSDFWDFCGKTLINVYYSTVAHHT